MCALLDFSCHAQSAIWHWWEGLGFGVQALIVGGAVLVIAGALWGFLSLLRAIGGWPAVGGALLVILGVVLAFVPRKPKGVEPDYEDGGDKPVRVPRPRTGDRRFRPEIGPRGTWQRKNPTTGKWENE